MHNGKCITVFSAPNYVGQMANKGAVIRLEFREDGVMKSLEPRVFDGLPTPEKYKAMMYSPIGGWLS
jgi:serine/threonine-protein phosphatase 5